MPTPYSLDLRRRVVLFYTAHHLSAAEISQQLCISEWTERTSEVEPKKQHHGPPKLVGKFEQLVLLRIIFWKYWNLFVSVATICRTLKFMDCTRQVIQYIVINIAVQRSDGSQGEIHGWSCSKWSFYASMDRWEWVWQKTLFEETSI